MRQRIGRLSGAPMDLAFSTPTVPALRSISVVGNDLEGHSGSASSNWCRLTWRRTAVR